MAPAYLRTQAHHPIFCCMPQETATKQEAYQSLLKQTEALLKEELLPSVHLCNVLSALREARGFFWVGLYLRKDEDTLWLGPYQGGLPCTQIAMGKGVCGLAAEQQAPQLINDVSQFPGYIACHPEPQAEIVLPGVVEGRSLFVLDIDALDKNAFDETDTQHLQQMVELMKPHVRALISSETPGGEQST